MADEITGMYATLEDPQAFLRHDLAFHRAVAAGSGNPIVATIIGTLVEIIWEAGRVNMQGVSRPSLRSGLRTLTAMGIIHARRGAGTFIVEGPPQLGPAPLQFMAALHGFTLDQMYEARRMLEVGAAGLAAARATGDQLVAMADEITGLYAALEDPQAFLRHDLAFHRAVAAGSGNPIVATMIGTLVEIIWEAGRVNMQGFSLRESADTHRRIYDAIRARSAERARREMTAHLEQARWEQVEGRMGPRRRPAPRPR
jgi:GntR family transcriptional repressor for pyruvate dehydrogenase complex